MKKKNEEKDRSSTRELLRRARRTEADGGHERSQSKSIDEWVPMELIWLHTLGDPNLEPEIKDHVHKLINRYLDSLEKKDLKERRADLDWVAEEIRKKIAKHRDEMIFLPNPFYNPTAKDSDQGNVHPVTNVPFSYHFGIAGPGRIYDSLARCFASLHVHRLRKCKHCRGLFWSPDNRKREFCPGTDHASRCTIEAF
jgi:hypothetical protein